MTAVATPTVQAEPYPVTEQEDNNFHFVTEHGNEYQITFSKYWQQDIVDLYLGFRVPVYEFYFEVMAKNHSGMDKRIAPTLFDIFDKFLLRTGSVIFYITQRDDGRSKELFKVYQLWYNLYKRSRGDELVKLDRAVYYGDTAEAYLACMFLRGTVKDKRIPLLVNTILEEIYPNATVSSL